MTVECTIAIVPNVAKDLWAVYEHYMSDGDPLLPPKLIYIGFDRLTEAFTMPMARHNSAWQQLTNKGERPLLVKIIALADNEVEAREYAISHLRTYQPHPYCNTEGYNMRGISRPIGSSDGRTFVNQTEAARALNVSQSAVSQHLNGHKKSVGGVTLSYVDN